MKIIEFLSMDGYYLYVWLSFGIAIIVMLALLNDPLKRKQQLLKQLGRKKRRGKRT